MRIIKHASPSREAPGAAPRFPIASSARAHAAVASAGRALELRRLRAMKTIDAATATAIIAMTTRRAGRKTTSRMESSVTGMIMATTGGDEDDWQLPRRRLRWRLAAMATAMAAAATATTAAATATMMAMAMAIAMAMATEDNAESGDWSWRWRRGDGDDDGDEDDDDGARDRDSHRAADDDGDSCRR